MITPATAYWNQRQTLSKLLPRFKGMGDAVGQLTDLTRFQWAQLASMALEFKPDLIIELGRGQGNSTCLFTEAANVLGNTKIVSLCLSTGFVEQTLPRLFHGGYVTPGWLKPLECWATDILFFDFESLLKKHDRVLIFWDAHGFEVASCVLGRILPILQHKEHIVMMHDMSDQRYSSDESLNYNDQILWRGRDADGARIVLGHINSAVPQAVSIVDFSCRNHIDLLTADHSLHTELKPDRERVAEMRHLLGDDFFSLQAHWLCFSLNDYPGPLTFPRFVLPEKPLSDFSVDLLQGINESL